MSFWGDLSRWGIFALGIVTGVALTGFTVLGYFLYGVAEDKQYTQLDRKEREL